MWGYSARSTKITNITPPSLPTSPVEDASLSQAITPLPSQPNTSPAPSHNSSQAGEDSALPQAGATPPREDASLSQVSTPPTPFPPSPLLSCLHRKTGELLTSLTSKQVNPTIQQTILGKVAGIPQGKAPPGLPGGSYYLPGRQ